MPKIIAGYASDTGRVRGKNEDLALVDPPLFAVADGMGGHAGGAEAAQLAITALRQSYRSRSDIEGLIYAIKYANFIVWQKGAENSHLAGMGTTLATLVYLAGDAPGSTSGGSEGHWNIETSTELSVGTRITGTRHGGKGSPATKKWYKRLLHTGRHTGRHDENAQRASNKPIHSYQSGMPQRGRSARDAQQGISPDYHSDSRSSGSTPHKSGGRFGIANVGDSRVYRYHNGKMVQISQDHSVAEEMVRKGELTGAEAAVHPKRHTLTRVIGMGQEIDVDVWELPAEEGDRFLLCTDGLSNEVSNEVLSEILAAQIDPQQATELMVQTANKNGGSDNITAVVVDVLPDSTVDNILQNDTIARSTEASHQLYDPPDMSLDNGLSIQPEDDSPDLLASSQSTSRSALQDNDTIGRMAGSNTKEERASIADGTTILSVAAIKTAADIGKGAASRSTVAQGNTQAQKNYAIKRTVKSSVSSPPIARWWHSGNSRHISTPDQGDHRYSRNGVKSARPSYMPARSSLRYEPQYRRYQGHRLISFRSVLFVIVFLAIVAGGFGLVRWYVNGSYFVMLKGNRIEVFQGRIGGFLGMEPHRVQAIRATASDIASYRLPQLKAGVEEPSIGAADAYIKDLLAEKRSLDQSSVSGISGSYICSTSCSINTVPPLGLSLPLPVTRSVPNRPSNSYNMGVPA